MINKQITGVAVAVLAASTAMAAAQQVEVLHWCII